MKFAPLMAAAVAICFVPQPAFSQAAAECATRHSPCHVDTRLTMAGIDDNRNAQAFLSAIKEAAQSGDREEIASRVRYPLSVYADGGETVYESPGALLRDFGQVFTPGVIEAIRRAEYASLFVNDQGAMLGDGEIWFDGWSGAILIKTVNAPDAGAGKAEAPHPSSPRGSVLWAQEMLNTLGYDAGPVDGAMGRKTRDALSGFQEDRGLEVTGMVDHRTVAMLAREEGADQPGFDCRKASSDAEIAICGSRTLSNLDSELAQAFRARRERLPAEASDAALQRQRAWLEHRDMCEGMIPCLEGSYRDRLTELRPGDGAEEPAAATSPDAAPAAAGGQTISILGAIYPLYPYVLETDIPAEWEDAKSYVPGWILSEPEKPIAAAERLGILERLALEAGKQREAGIMEAAERHFERSGSTDRDLFELELAEACMANDPAGYLSMSTVALCQEHIALEFLLWIVRYATPVQESSEHVDQNAAVIPAGSAPAVAVLAGTAPETFRDCDECPEMVVLSPGTYWMGATEEDAALPNTEYSIPTELPRHEVTFDYSFAIGKFTVTVAEFAAFVDDTGHKAGGECFLRLPDSGPNKGRFIGKISLNAGEYERGPGMVLVEHADFRTPGVEVGDRHPATCVSRNEAKVYLSWLSEKTGRKYRFPTEAEWEYAARAGETKPFYYGGGRDELCAYGNFADRDSVYGASMHASCAEAPSHEYTLPVGSLKPNDWGLYDMVGNVFEYVEDCYFPNYEGAPDDGSPWKFSDSHGWHSTPSEGECQVWGLRGYFFDSLDIALRSAARCGVYDDEDDRGNEIGIRVAVSMSEGAWDSN